MNLAHRIFAFYINSSIHVAMSVVAMTYITVLEYSLPNQWELLAFVFLATITGYNFVKYSKIAGLHHRNLTHSLKAIQIFSAICFLFFIYLGFQLPLSVLLIIACLGLSTFLYAIPFLKHRNLRNLSGVKVFIVALVWAGMTVLVPINNSKLPLSVDVLLTFFQRILIVVVLIFPFEIRDIHYDDAQLKTLPQQIGVLNTKILGEVIIILCLVLEYFKEVNEMAYVTSTLIFTVLLGAVLIASKTHQSRYYSSFWVESLPVLWLILYMFFELI